MFLLIFQFNLITDEKYVISLKTNINILIAYIQRSHLIDSLLNKLPKFSRFQ